MTIEAGDEKAVQMEIAMNNSSGLFQIDELLATKLRGSGIEEHVEVVAGSRQSTRSGCCPCSGSSRAGSYRLRGSIRLVRRSASR